MKEYIVTRELIVRYHPGSLNPIDINEDYLKKAGIVNDENKLNRGMLRIGSLGTNIIFDNDTNDEIRVKPFVLMIESTSEERIEHILKSIKNSYGSITLSNGEYSFETHLTDKNFPNSIFKNYIKTEGVELEIIYLKKNNVSLSMYSCGPNRIHLTTKIKCDLNKQFENFDFKKDLQLHLMDDFYSEFKRNDLKL